MPLHVPASVNQVTGPATISSPGRYVLQNDVVNDPYQSSWNGILITSSDVWLDGMGHTIDGMDSPLNMSVRGVYAYTGSALSNITVTNLTVRNCWQGVDYYLVQDGLIDHVVSRDNPYIGIGLLYSKNITIANGVATNNSGIGISIHYNGDDNTVVNTTISNNLWAYDLVNATGNIFRNITSIDNTDGDDGQCGFDLRLCAVYRPVYRHLPEPGDQLELGLR